MLKKLFLLSATLVFLCVAAPVAQAEDLRFIVQDGPIDWYFRADNHREINLAAAGIPIPGIDTAYVLDLVAVGSHGSNSVFVTAFSVASDGSDVYRVIRVDDLRKQTSVVPPRGEWKPLANSGVYSAAWQSFWMAVTDGVMKYNPLS